MNELNIRSWLLKNNTFIPTLRTLTRMQYPNRLSGKDAFRCDDVTMVLGIIHNWTTAAAIVMRTSGLYALLGP